MSQTFALIKPDALKKGVWGEILFRIQKARFELVAMKTVTLSRELLEEFYQEHQGKPFFPDMIARMNQKASLALVLEAPQSIKNFRVLLGSTNPAHAPPGSLRHDYGENLDANAVHGSDSLDSAKREIDLFFPELKSAKAEGSLSD